MSEVKFSEERNKGTVSDDVIDEEEEEKNEKEDENKLNACGSSCSTGSRAKYKA